MKWLFFSLGLVAAAAGIVVSGKWYQEHRLTEPEPAPDGGLQHYQSGDDAPKVIKSTEIIAFTCTISLLANAEPGELENRVYELSAAVKDGIVSGELAWYDRINSAKHPFTAELSFMEELQAIVSAHDLARHNGYYYEVSGLPNMYGDALDIRYASGEYIHARDNQNGFLSREAQHALIKFFAAQIQAKP